MRNCVQSSQKLIELGAKSSMSEGTPPVKWLFEDVFDQNFSRIYNYIYSKTSNATEAEDLTAEVFVKAYEHYHRYDPQKCGVHTWLRSIAHNTVVDYFRKKSRMNRSNQILENIPSEQDLEAGYIEQEVSDHLMALIQELPKHQQELLTLKYFLGMNNREISRAVGMSESNVGTTLHRVLRRLKGKMEKY